MLVALRADSLAEVALHSAFSRLVERGLYLVGGLDEDGLRSTIETPARQAGLLVEPGLVDLLVAEVARDPGALPLLSHALLETWQRREGRTLTAAGYRDSGGIQGAVAQSAEQLYAALDPDERPHLRDVMLRLVIPDDEGDPVRAKVPRQTAGSRRRAATSWSNASSRPAWSPVTRACWPSATKPSPGPGPGCAPGSTTTSTASGSCTTSRPPPTAGTRSVGPTPSSTAASGWPGPWPGRTNTARSLNPVETDFLAASREAEEVAERSAAEHARTTDAS